MAIVREAHLIAQGITSESAKTFIRIRRDLRLRIYDMALILGTTSMAVSFYERGLRNPKPAIREKLRNLAFHHHLSYAAEVFPEVDLPDAHQCPMCRQLAEYHRRRRYQAGELEDD